MKNLQKEKIKTENIKRIKKLQRLKVDISLKEFGFKCRRVKLSGLAQKGLRIY